MGRWMSDEEGVREVGRGKGGIEPPLDTQTEDVAIGSSEVKASEEEEFRRGMSIEDRRLR